MCGPVTDVREAEPTRVPSLDVLRGVAIVCMLIAHGVPFVRPSGISAPLDLTFGAISAVASPLFGLAMGAAAALVWARPSMAGGWPRRTLSDIGRGVVVFAAGMLLVELNTWVAIVLQVLGVLMVIGIPVAALSGASMRAGVAGARLQWLLGGLTVLGFVLAPIITATVVPQEERLFNGTTGGLAEVWAAFIAGYSYRAVSLLPFFAVGALLTTTGLLARPRRLGLLAGVTAMVLAPAYMLMNDADDVRISGDFVDQTFDAALVAIAVTAAAAMVAVVPWREAWQPLADLGAIALSVYALQLVVLRPMMEWEAWRVSALWGWVTLVLFVVVPSAAMVLWRRTLGPGPLERVVALVTGKGQAS